MTKITIARNALSFSAQRRKLIAHSCDHDCQLTEIAQDTLHACYALFWIKQSIQNTPNNQDHHELTSHFFIPHLRSQFYISSRACAPPSSFIFTLLTTVIRSWLKEGVIKHPSFSPAWPPTCNLGNGRLEPATIEETVRQWTKPSLVPQRLLIFVQLVVGRKPPIHLLSSG